MISTKLLYKIFNEAIKEHDRNVELFYIARRAYEVCPHEGTKEAFYAALELVLESESKFKMYAQYITELEERRA